MRPRFLLFSDPATTEIYTLSLHDALPISRAQTHRPVGRNAAQLAVDLPHRDAGAQRERDRSEEHTSELQSHSDLVCRLLLEKKKISKIHNPPPPGEALVLSQSTGKLPPWR